MKQALVTTVTTSNPRHEEVQEAFATPVKTILVSSNHELIETVTEGLLPDALGNIVQTFPDLASLRTSYLQSVQKQPAPMVIFIDLDSAVTTDLAHCLLDSTHHPEIKVVLLAQSATAKLASGLLQSGAEDLIIRPFTERELRLTLRSAALSALHSIARFKRLLLKDESLMQLTPREIQICRCIDAGLTNKEIASLLHIAVRTVKLHRQHAMAKLGKQNQRSVRPLHAWQDS